MKVVFKSLFPILFLFAILFLGYSLGYKNKIHPQKFVLCQSSHPDWETPILDQNLQTQIFNQDFFYLGQGKQSYVFLSKDDQYIIKFAKLNHYKRTQFLSFLPFCKFLHKNCVKKTIILNKRLLQYLDSQKLTFDNLSQECALLYCHLNKTSSLNRKLALYDPWKRKFIVDLDDHIFIIQKKIPSYQNILFDYQKNHQTEKVRQYLKKMVDFHQKLLHRCLVDTDKGFYKNYGILNNEIVCMDTGNFIYDANLQDKNHLNQRFNFLFKKMRLWVQKNFPEEKVFFDVYLKNQMQDS
jgi:hypothetical protein